MKKVLSLILAFAMIMTMASVFAAELPDGAATITVTGKDGGYFTKTDGDKTGILRFLSKIEYDDGYELESYGMKFIPLSIFEDDAITDKTWASVESTDTEDYASGDTFSADLENISEDYFSKEFLGVGFAKFKNYDTVLFTDASTLSSNKVEGTKNLGTKQDLQCDVNGDFTILIVADPHAGWEAAKENLETLIVKTNPDFVIIHGDIYMSAYGAMNADGFISMVEPITKRGIPWATTNGNHDPYTDTDWATFTSLDGFLGKKVSESDPNYVEERPVNYVLPVYANDGTTPVFNIWAMDTGRTTASGQYDGVTETQIDWYKAESAKLKTQYKKDLTGLMCVHIPPTEMIDLYYSKVGGGTNTVGNAGDANQPIYGAVYGTFAGVTNYTTSTGTVVSSTAMNATYPANNRGLFAAMKEMGNIDISISGHDHANNFIGVYDGIMMGFTGRIVDETYSRGARVVKFNQANPEKFTTQWISLCENGEDQPEIYKDGTLVDK